MAAAEKGSNRDIEYVFNYSQTNKAVFEELLELVRENSVVPFVGAGLSCPFYPLWGKSLQIIAENLLKDNGEELSNVLSELSKPNPNYLEIANKLASPPHSVEEVVEVMKSLFNSEKHRSRRSEIRERAVWLLPQLFPRLAFTTNFDRMLNDVYEWQDHRVIFSLCPKEKEKLQAAILEESTEASNGSTTVFHVHGQVEENGMIDPDTLVFTGMQYTERYEHNADVKNFLVKVYKAKSFLFLGCSLKDDKTVEVLEKVCKQKKDEGKEKVNFAIVDCKKDDMVARRSELEGKGIHALFYPTGQHDCVRVILKELLRKGFPVLFRRFYNEEYDNRFVFDFCLTNTVGRESELNQLREFLLCDEKRAWFTITGPPGSGKSRLTWEFCRNLPNNWKAIWVDPNNLPTECSSAPTLYVWDDANRCDYDKTIELACRVSKIPVKSRLLLLMREQPDDLEYFRRNSFRMKSWTEWKEPLQLKHLSDGHLMALMNNYAETVRPLNSEYKRCPTQADVEKILDSLRGDEFQGGQTPFSALIAMDSWLAGEQEYNWNKQLDFWFYREVGTIEKRLKELTGSPIVDSYLKAILSLLMLSTVCNGTVNLKELEESLPSEWKVLLELVATVHFTSVSTFLNHFGFPPSNGFLHRVTPDILGEFFVLKCVEKNYVEGAKIVRTALKYHFLPALVFLDKLFHDFKENLDQKPSDWAILLPEDVTLLGEENIYYYSWTMKNCVGLSKDKEVKKAFLQRLDKLRRNNDTVPLKLEYYKAVVNCVDESCREVAEKALDELKELSKTDTKNAEFARHYVKLLAKAIQFNIVSASDNCGELVNLARDTDDNWALDSVNALGVAIKKSGDKKIAEDALTKLLQFAANPCGQLHDVAKVIANGLCAFLFLYGDSSSGKSVLDHLERVTLPWNQEREFALERFKGIATYIKLEPANVTKELLKRMIEVFAPHKNDPDFLKIWIDVRKFLLQAGLWTELETLQNHLFHSQQLLT